MPLLDINQCYSTLLNTCETLIKPKMIIISLLHIIQYESTLPYACQSFWTLMMPVIYSNVINQCYLTPARHELCPQLIVILLLDITQCS
jgi:hypothetical protein